MKRPLLYLVPLLILLLVTSLHIPFTHILHTEPLPLLAHSPATETVNQARADAPPALAALVSPPARHPIQGTVFYFVMPDRFANGDPANDTGGIAGNRLDHGFDPTNSGFFHGGDLAGLTSKLDYLADMGISAIWMTPVFKNNPVQGRGASASAAYHGYWYTDMTQFDPHFGTNAELEELIEQAHARGIKIFFDIIANHTADILSYQEGAFTYRNKANFPYKDAAGVEFDDRAYAGGSDFPELDAETSFPYTPVFNRAGDETLKVPAWLNNPIYYHNRGDSTFSGENSLYGDFFGLDDLFTEHPDVVNGMIDIYKDWISNYDIDGFRVDTVKHVNLEFWQAFVPAILEHAAAQGKEDFFIFGEVFSGDEMLLSHYTTLGQFPAVLDFKFQEAVRRYVSGGAGSNALRNLFADDDYYTDANSNAYSLPTFIGNHDRGRFAHFLDEDNGPLPDAEKLARIKLAHALMFLARGAPVIYYGDEQGFVGDGDDKNARQDMFPSQVASYNDDDLVGTDATTAADNFDETHPLFTSFGALAELYRAHPALQTGAQIHRRSSIERGIYAFSRIDRDEQLEYVVAVNNSGEMQTASIPTFYAAGQRFTPIVADGYVADGQRAPSPQPAKGTDADGALTVSVQPFGYIVYKADAALPASTAAPNIAFNTPNGGQQFDLNISNLDGNDVPQRIEVGVDLTTALGRDQLAEVTFAVRINGGDYVRIGVDDNPPYRVFYDASELEPGAKLDFASVVSDLNGHLNYAEVTGIQVGEAKPAAGAGYDYGAIHYLRDDGDYGNDTSSDFNGFWGLHLWGDAIAPAEVTEWTAPKPFRGETDCGRMALIKMQDATRDVNFIVHRGDTKDGAEQDRKFNPAVDGPEIWLKQGDGAFYTSQAAAQGYVTIHYQRADSNYGDPASGDFNDFWGLHLWGDAIADGVGTEWAGPRPFDAIDEFGAYWDIPIQDASQPVNFIIHRGDAKDPGPDQSLNPQVGAAVWITSGNEEIYMQEGAAANVATIHYQRADGDYGDPTSSDFNDFWGLHVWEGAATPSSSWEQPVKPAGVDAFGPYWRIPLADGAGQLAYIIHRGDAKDPGPDQFLDLSEYGYAVWQYEGANPEAPYAYPLRPGAAVGGGDLSKAQAHWVSADTLAWNFAADDATLVGAGVALYYSKDGGMMLKNGVISGGESIPLTPVKAGLSRAIKAQFPHLAGLNAYKIGGADLAKVPDILKGQTAIVATQGNVVINATGLQIPGVLDDLYAYDGPLGPEFAEPPLIFAPVTLRLWAPTAQSVKLHLFASAAAETAEQVVEMTPTAQGVWETTIQEIWIGKYYLYEVKVYAPSTGRVETNLVTDPYSLGLSMNSTRSLLVNLNDPSLMPEGWNELSKPLLAAPTDIVLYELHMRDFSANDQKVAAENRGKFTAFAEKNSDGLKHLQKLAKAGLTHIHLLPVFDIATINEDPSQRQEPDIPTAAGPASAEQAAAVHAVRDLDAYNWGYDPFHFTVPEGSYATDPNGTARILEFRQMVQALNAMGLRVVMDVVYNHTSAAGQNDKSVLDKIVPGYYHRLDEDGKVATSTCCANTATEHAMMRKLMLDSLRTWATQYKVDGFRFDLMGHHMKADMLAVRAMLDEIDPTIYIYGEGWNFGEVANNARGVNATQLNMAGTGIGAFNDRVRDAVRGGGPFDGGPDLITKQGFSNGLWYNPNANNRGSEGEKEQLLLYADQIRVGMAGNLADFQFVDRNGFLVTGAAVSYNGATTGYTQSPQENIIYVSAHDNQTLFDNNVYKLPSDTPMAQRVAAQNLAIDIALLSQGIPFLHAGVEMLRSKSLERDSYNSGDWFNRLYFDYSANNFGVGLPMETNGDAALMTPLLKNRALQPAKSDISQSVAHVQKMLTIRAASPLFRLRTKAEVMQRVHFHNTGPEQIPGLIVMSISDKIEGADLDPDRDMILVFINATTQPVTFVDETLSGLTLNGERGITYDASRGAFTVPAQSTAVLSEGEPLAPGAIMLR
ncbi:MAG: pullulanase-type alpha-1,6-glucosidase [Caldilineaceae bacterium]